MVRLVYDNRKLIFIVRIKNDLSLINNNIILRFSFLNNSNEVFGFNGLLIQIVTSNLYFK